ncbi:hypothetical protein L226DRAFT_63524 [Lentinus tigrinus ALCF2SS1-7]|uniref:MYND-type domain-containing protein n=1 Tax=Lentinus tigrinus ALCF2SS1-6 TaxID=1328759 RepID=A0A5C2SF87_9APHY|nr:hypothetical protein L227DRAFT_104042 [Lentinus tigrinus ALCF2SS1-6]RPD74729.1 hypothetical protein L226DRAFT_63524 [Lentinus tigrinus ALCF2SS1-7]
MSEEFCEAFNKANSMAAASWEQRYLHSSRLQEKLHKRAVVQRCDYCGKDDEGKLQACSLCRSVHYCGRACQLADYKARHRGDCVGFVRPPYTAEFLTEPIAEAKFAQAPVFASGHKDGVGFWVSVVGNVEASLVPLVDPVCPKSALDGIERFEKAVLEPGRALRCGLEANNLLTVVLVQNRRKDRQSVLVLSAQCQLVSCLGMTDDVMKGRVDGERSFLWQQSSGSGEAAVLCVVDDQWNREGPRLCVTHINGTKVTSSHRPPQVLDARRGILALDPGD